MANVIWMADLYDKEGLVIEKIEGMDFRNYFAANKEIEFAKVYKAIKLESGHIHHEITESYFYTRGNYKQEISSGVIKLR